MGASLETLLDNYETVYRHRPTYEDLGLCRSTVMTKAMWRRVSALWPERAMLFDVEVCAAYIFASAVAYNMGKADCKNLTTPEPTVVEKVVVKEDPQSEILRARNEALQKSLRSIEYELNSAHAKELAEKDAEIERLKQELEQRRREDEINDEVEQAGELLELPTTGVVFIGGHVNLVNKLKSIYPGWRYIAFDNDAAVYGNPDIAFIHVGHISHKNSTRAEDSIPSERRFNVYGTNIERLVDSMRYFYTKQKEREKA